MADFRTNLANFLSAKQGDLTQQQFARKIGVHQSSLNRLLLGEQNVMIDTLQRICKRLKCTAGELLDD
ncbi:helix-turn-helix domain-containing protein [Hyphococcus luteus]|uniref:HTH cro/C1-type domain-containing protein n=1 Tax=Hyphococcus luteus TaxID=2058213 RepID=A0A2S7K3V2_9PROT|nr:hypothetical protein CW354_14235 [Marinicaulis flavus]